MGYSSMAGHRMSLHRHSSERCLRRGSEEYMTSRETSVIWREPTIQQQLDALFDALDLDGIAELPGFRIAIDASTFGIRMTCFQYVFGQRSAEEVTAAVDTILEKGIVIPQDDIDRGHVVFYSPGGVIISVSDIKHVAIGVGPGVVQSIFGNWTHGYEHPYEYVPGKYGGNIAAFIKPQGVLLNAGLHGIV